VLDEPTTGLHFEDIRKLLGVLGRLVDKGNSVIVIEHNLDVIKTADWIVDIDMGAPGGGRHPSSGGSSRSGLGRRRGHALKGVEGTPALLPSLERQGGQRLHRHQAAVVVTQPTAGEYKAFTAVCTHMQCIVGSVANNVIQCPCHGSQYSAKTGESSRARRPRRWPPRPSRSPATTSFSRPDPPRRISPVRTPPAPATSRPPRAGFRGCRCEAVG
jgi:nitrite reductase/ring-hydroxylating ferredoxin subunit